MTETKNSTHQTPPPHSKNKYLKLNYFFRFKHKFTSPFSTRIDRLSSQVTGQGDEVHHNRSENCFSPTGTSSRCLRPGRSMWRTFIPAAPCARRNSTRPETEHNIDGTPAHTLASRRYQSFFRHIKLGHLFPQISGQSKGTTTGYHSDRLGTFSPAAPKFFGRAARRVSPQSGRTLLETLAVLAIIGILSVAALGGLMWAFAKYRANDTIHDVHIWQLAALDSNQLFDMTSGQLILPELGSVSTHGYPMAVWIQDKDVFTVHVNDVPKRVCSLMLDMIDENQTLTVNDVRFNNNDICTNDTNALVFYMNKDMGNVGSICIPSCEEGETCCGGECRTIQTPCGTDGCTDCGGDYCTTSNTCCPTPTATKCGDTDCCDTKCCNGVCCPESYMTCDATTTCGCPNNMVPDADTGACKCPDDAPYFFEEAGICCKSGYTPVDGACQKIDCRGGPTNYRCYINDVLCGYDCDALGQNCTGGICYASQCRSDEKFGEIPFAGNYMTYYGCFRENPNNENIMCVSSHPKESNYQCYLKSDNPHSCCVANTNLECTTGSCELSCPDGWEEVFENNYSYSFCKKTENGTDFYCYVSNGRWYCKKNNRTCNEGNACDEVDTCCRDGDECHAGYTYNTVTQRCENADGGYCEPMESGSHAYQTCYDRDDNPVCVMYGLALVSNGACSDPGCPEGMVYGRVTNDYWGCVDETLGTKGMACYHYSGGSGSFYYCYYNGEECARQCQNYNGTDCNVVYLPQCALAGHCPQTGYDMSGGCICDGDVTSADGTDYCCPTGHTYINGACAMT